MEEITEEPAFICKDLNGLLREADEGRARDLQEGSSQSVVHCQEIGLVALMFFFELLFSYVSLTISFYVSLTNLFSIILFLIC